MQSLEAACEEGERAIKKLKSSRSSLPLLRPQEPSETKDSSPSKPPFCIFTKLLELHEEFAGDDNDTVTRGLNPSSLLLEKLVARERLNTLILNLYAGDKGFSLTFRSSTSRTDPNSEDTANMMETDQWPYEMDELLQYIDNEELPPYLLKTLDEEFSYLFYSGCVIVEVRDYRQAYPHFKCDIHHVLLRPTLNSILADINNIVEEKVEWGKEERLQLESQLLLANKPTLHLNPDNSICEQISEINHRKQMWSSHKFRRCARKFSQETVYRKKKLKEFITQSPRVNLFECITKLKTKPKTALGLNQKVTKKLLTPIPVPNLDPPPIAAPSQGIAINEFKVYQRPKDSDDCQPQLIEEYVLETDIHPKEENKPIRVYHIKLSILQRPSTLEYLGELYLDRDHKKNEQNGVACRFSLGSRVNAKRYIHQFTEIFSESGRKSVRMRYGLSPGCKEKVAMAQAQVNEKAKMQAQNPVQSTLAQQHFTQLAQSLPNHSAPLVNGTINSGIGLVHQSQTMQNTSNVPILRSHLQGTNQIKTPQQVTTEKMKLNALFTDIRNSAQQFQAAADAKQQQQQQQQQQQKMSSSGNHAALINLLNQSPASNINSDASAAVVNAINNSSLLPQQLQTTNQKLLARKMTLPNVANARVLNHSNLIALNNNRMNFQELNTRLGQQQPQTITFTSVNNSSTSYTNYTTVPIKQQQVNQRILTNSNSESSNKSLSALLVGTPAANRPEIVSSIATSLLLEKLPGASNNGSTSQLQGSTHFIQSPKGGQQFMVQSPKANTVLSPLSSPPPQSTNTINVQGLNLAHFQSISGLQNVQLQLPVFAQPISLLNVSSTGNIQGHPTNLIVSVPVSTANTSNTITQAATNRGTGVNSLGVGGSTVVLANAGTSNLTQLVSGGVKGISQQGLRNAGPQTVSISQGGQPFQLITPLQRPRMQQSSSNQQNVSSRTIQRSQPITIKMTAPTTNTSQASLPSNATIANQLQKQAQLQYQQLCMNQPNILGKLRRRSNTSDPQ